MKATRDSADEIGALLPEYFAECVKRNIFSVRVIHGKGTGTLREGVQRLLEKTPGVGGMAVARRRGERRLGREG